MRYRVRVRRNSKSIIIRSENAAKPKAQASSHVLALLRALPHVSSSFDFGCGKLRYSSFLLRRTDSLAIVDSATQLSRNQRIGSKYTSAEDVCRASNQMYALDIKEFRNIHGQFDRGFCINVLSVIPIPSCRERAIKSMYYALRPHGTCLFAVQYRNSDFERMKKLSHAKKWRDGILVNSLRGYSYYGLIYPEQLCDMVEAAGFVVDKLSKNEGSAYVVGRKPH